MNILARSVRRYAAPLGAAMAVTAVALALTLPLGGSPAPAAQPPAPTASSSTATTPVLPATTGPAPLQAADAPSDEPTPTPSTSTTVATTDPEPTPSATETTVEPTPTPTPTPTGIAPIGNCTRDPCLHLVGTYDADRQIIWDHLGGLHGVATGHCIIDVKQYIQSIRESRAEAGETVTFYVNGYDDTVTIGAACGIYVNA